MTLPIVALIILVLLMAGGIALFRLGKDEGIRETEIRMRKFYEIKMAELAKNLGSKPVSMDDHFGVSVPGAWGKAGEAHPPVRVDSPCDDGTCKRDND